MRAPRWVGLLVGLSCFSFHCADSLRNPKARVHVDGLWRDGYGGGGLVPAGGGCGGAGCDIPPSPFPQREKVAAWKGG